MFMSGAETGSHRCRVIGEPPGGFETLSALMLRIEARDGAALRVSGDVFAMQPAAGGPYAWALSFVSVDEPVPSPANPALFMFRLAVTPGQAAFRSVEARLEFTADGERGRVFTLAFERKPRSANPEGVRRIHFGVQTSFTGLRQAALSVHDVEPQDFGPAADKLRTLAWLDGAELDKAVALGRMARARFGLLLQPGKAAVAGLVEGFAAVDIAVTCTGPEPVSGRLPGQLQVLAGLQAADEGLRWSEPALNSALQRLEPESRDPLRHLRDPFRPFRFSLLLASHYVSDELGDASRIVIGAMFDTRAAVASRPAAGVPDGDARADGPRQGAALFFLAIGLRLHMMFPAGPGDADIDRLTCFFAMHELAHAMNLPHCFDYGRGLGRGALPELSALSFTAYPQIYGYGQGVPTVEPTAAAQYRGRYERFMDAFWAQDAANRFTERERLHLRHAAYGDIADQQSSLFA